MPLTIPFVDPQVQTDTAGSNIVQTVLTQLAANRTTTSTTFVDLLTQSITTQAGTTLLIWIAYTASFSVGVASSAMLRLTIDGTEYLRCGEEEWTSSQSGAMVYRATGLTAAAHTIALQWRIATAGDGTFRCRNGTVPEGASILSMEVRV